MDLETKRRLYARCRNEPLEPDSPFNVDIDDQEGHVRGVDWVDALATKIVLADSARCQFITGLPGSGKSTELKRLCAKLQGRPGEDGYVVALIDTEERLDITQPIALPDIIALLVDGAERAVRAAEGAPEVVSDGYIERLWRWLATTEPILQEATVKAGPVDLLLEMRARPDFRKEIRDATSRHFTTFLSQALVYLEQLDQRVRDLGHTGLCIILDSLERLQGLSTNWEKVLDSAVRVFESPYVRLPVHCIYTVPAALLTRSKLDVEFMPMVKLRTPDGEIYEPGCRAFREMVRLRIGDEFLEMLLGKDFERKIREVIESSGGYPRELVHALRWILELPEHPASDDDLERYRYRNIDKFRYLVTGEDLPWLVRVAKEKMLRYETHADRARADLALRNNLVMRYLNQRDWWDLHPAVRQLEEVQAAIAAD